MKFVLKFLGRIEDVIKNAAQIHVVSGTFHKRLLAGMLTPFLAHWNKESPCGRFLNMRASGNRSLRRRHN
jgi:hypothetical protein